MILAEPSVDTTVITGPCATTVDVQEWLDRAGWHRRTYANGGADAQFVLEGGYFPEIDSTVAHHGWRVVPLKG